MNTQTGALELQRSKKNWLEPQKIHPIEKKNRKNIWTNQTSMTFGVQNFWIFQGLQTPVFFHPFSDLLKLTFSTWPWEKLPCLVHLSLVLPKDQNPWSLRFYCPHLEFKPTKFRVFWLDMWFKNGMRYKSTLTAKQTKIPFGCIYVGCRLEFATF